MKVLLLSQFSNFGSEKSIASAIISVLRTSNYTKMRAMVAFANYGGVSGLAREIAKSGIKEKNIIVGIDNKITTVEALQCLINLGFEGKVYHTSGSEIFHPKFYLFENANVYSLIVGSANMTTGGLALNDECAILIEGTKNESIYVEANDTFNRVWNTVEVPENPIITSLNDETIGRLYVQEYILSEKDTRENLATSDEVETFGTNPRKDFPSGFSPQAITESINNEIELYKHNKIIYGELTAFLSKHDKGYVVQPTGTGKSYLMAKYISEHKGENIIVVAPNNIILEELKKILGGDTHHVVFRTYQFFSADLKRTKQIARKVKHILIDEFHHLGAEGWGNAIKELIDNAHNPKVIGFSATPKRDFDDINVPELFFENNCIHELTLFEAWKEKILPVPTLVQSYVELDELLNNLEQEVSYKQKLSNNTRKALHEKLEEIKSKYIADTSLQKVITDFIPKDIKKIIVFVPRIESMDETEQKLTPCFKELGVVPHSFRIHSKQSDKENDRQLEMFQKDFGGVNIIYSVDKLIEGLHVDGVDALILLRSTNSVRIALQQLGRCLSSSKTKKPIVLDVVNNYRAKEIFGITIDGMQRTAQGDGELSDIFIHGNYMEINEAISNLLAKYNSWEDNFQMLVEFKETNGRPPKNSDNCQKLYSWWISQRKQYRDKTMQEERIVLFKQHGFVLDDWEENFNLLMKFIEENNMYPKRKDGSIGLWLIHQRQNYRDHILSDEHANLLLSKGIPLLIKKNWGEWFEQLKWFLKTYKREPRSISESSLEKSLYGWLNRQRQEYKEGVLDENKINFFSDLGVSLVASEMEIQLNDRFETFFNQLQEFVNKHHRLPKFKENEKLYEWIGGEKDKIKKGTIKKEREERLRGLGVTVESGEEWIAQFNEIKRYVQFHDHLPIKGENKWWDKQIWAYKKISINRSGLSNEQIKMLEEIGITDDSMKKSIKKKKKKK